MAIGAKRPCNRPGCGALLSTGAYCEAHAKVKRKDADSRRGSSTARGYGSRWQRYRKHYLARHPLCVRCDVEGLTVEAKDVDHIKPVTGPGDPLFWEPSNHQALCHPCHSHKTATEDGGWGRGV